MPHHKTIGFIGLGVMGEPICRNLVRRSGARVIAFDVSPEPLARLKADGADVAASAADSSAIAKSCSCAFPAPNTCAQCSKATAF
jgi:3-hydroxyisobutyrate dehydrogenase-like beta-hydroxyacid dehydrogenase